MPIELITLLVGVGIALFGWLLTTIYNYIQRRLSSLETTVNKFETQQAVDNDRWNRQEETNKKVVGLSSDLAVTNNKVDTHDLAISEIKGELGKINDKLDQLIASR